MRIIVSFFCGIFGALTASPFMLSFDSVSDTLLFCIALHSKREQLELQKMRENEEQTYLGMMWLPIRDTAENWGVCTAPRLSKLTSLAAREQLRGANALIEPPPAIQDMHSKTASFMLNI